MLQVADVYGEGVSASKAFGRVDLDEVLTLGRREPFEVLLVRDYSRSSRSGIGLSNDLETELAAEGVEVISVNDALPEDADDAELIKSVKRKRNRNSPCLLAGHLREATSGHTTRGHTTRRSNKSRTAIYRYHFDGSTHVYATRGVQFRRVRAEALEAEVAGAVSEVLNATPDLGDRVRQHVRRAAADRPRVRSAREQLEIEQAEVSDQRAIASQRPAAGRRAIAARMGAWDRRPAEIDAELARIGPAEAADSFDEDAAAAHVLERLAAFGAGPQALPRAGPESDVRPGCTGASPGASWANVPSGLLTPLSLAKIRTRQGRQRRRRPPSWSRKHLAGVLADRNGKSLSEPKPAPDDAGVVVEHEDQPNPLRVSTHPSGLIVKPGS